MAVAAPATSRKRRRVHPSASFIPDHSPIAASPFSRGGGVDSAGDQGRWIRVVTQPAPVQWHELQPPLVIADTIDVVLAALRAAVWPGAVNEPFCT